MSSFINLVGFDQFCLCHSCHFCEWAKPRSLDFLNFPQFILLINFDRFPDIDQLTRILVLCGTPNEETLNKITSDEARNYIRSLSHMERKNFSDVFKGANPLGKKHKQNLDIF